MVELLVDVFKDLLMMYPGKIHSEASPISFHGSVATALTTAVVR
jgi:hypothetical protein